MEPSASAPELQLHSAAPSRGASIASAASLSSAPPARLEVRERARLRRDAQRIRDLIISEEAVNELVPVSATYRARADGDGGWWDRWLVTVPPEASGASLRKKVQMSKKVRARWRLAGRTAGAFAARAKTDLHYQADFMNKSRLYHDLDAASPTRVSPGQGQSSPQGSPVLSPNANTATPAATAATAAAAGSGASSLLSGVAGPNAPPTSNDPAPISFAARQVRASPITTRRLPRSPLPASPHAAAAYSPASPVSVDDDEGSVCETCGLRRATLWCGGECGTGFCALCWDRVHARGSLKEHARVVVYESLPLDVSCDEIRQATDPGYVPAHAVVGPGGRDRFFGDCKYCPRTRTAPACLRPQPSTSSNLPAVATASIRSQRVPLRDEYLFC